MLVITRVEAFRVHQFNGRLQALPTNIRLRYKRMGVTNTLPYYDTATITAVNSFIGQAPVLTVYIVSGLDLVSHLKLGSGPGIP
jgi:hypothetical protein